jgi:AcrR family transcriptional regulator
MQARSPWGTAEQRVTQRRNKHEALLSTAATLFKQQGFAGASLDQIAAQLGITKPTLYYYVPSKAQLVLACAARGFEQALDAMQTAQRASHGPQGRNVLKAYAKVLATDFGWCMVRIDEWMQPAALRKSIQQQRQALEQCLEGALASNVSASMALRALEGVALGLPQNQWAPMVDLLCTPFAPSEQAPSPVVVALSVPEVATEKDADHDRALLTVEPVASVEIVKAVKEVDVLDVPTGESFATPKKQSSNRSKPAKAAPPLAQSNLF